VDEIELAALKGEIDSLSAETLALLVVVASLANRLRVLPGASGAVLKAFDDASSLAEKLSIQRGRGLGHLPKSLEIIEQLRNAVVGESEPKHGV
jgi:hypothetical protein